MDIKRLKEIMDLPIEYLSGDRRRDLYSMLPEIIERLAICRNCKKYVQQDHRKADCCSKMEDTVNDDA